MKKVLSYAVTAILLGAVTMLAPLMLISDGGMIPSNYAQAPGGLETCTHEGDALERVASPSNLSSAGLMLIPSFLLALGVSLYLKKRIL